MCCGGSVCFRRKKKAYGSEMDSMVANARSKINTGNNVLNTVRRSQSLGVSVCSVYVPACMHSSVSVVRVCVSIFDSVYVCFGGRG